eukprot:scaffold182393_cov41-Prasinocladus_malaysianus.AAC.1
MTGNLLVCLRSGNNSGLGRNGVASARPSTTDLRVTAAMQAADDPPTTNSNNNNGDHDEPNNDYVAQVRRWQPSRQPCGCAKACQASSATYCYDRTVINRLTASRCSAFYMPSKR